MRNGIPPLDFVPDAITAGGKTLQRRQDLSEEGYVFDDAKHVLRIHHTSSRDIDIQGKGGHVPPSLVTFDNPHLTAGTALNGEYPSGVIDWGQGEWQIGVPHGKFGTFNLTLEDPQARSAEFEFYSPRIFAGLDVYNDGPAEATVTIHSPEIRETSYKIKPGELRRIRTDWRDPSSSVIFNFENGQGLRFDNLAYSHE